MGQNYCCNSILTLKFILKVSILFFEKMIEFNYFYNCVVFVCFVVENKDETIMYKSYDFTFFMADLLLGAPVTLRVLSMLYMYKKRGILHFQCQKKRSFQKGLYEK